jgi:hypothetical protein
MARGRIAEAAKRLGAQISERSWHDLRHGEPWRFVGALQGSAGVIGLSGPFGTAELNTVNNVRAKA